jgi:hypothetical protein
MASAPKKVVERLVPGIKRFQPILSAAKARDVGESDTVTIVKDMLADVFGYDKYSEVTSEYSIRGTFCDLATKIDGTLQALIEVKAIGIELKDSHVKQVVDYAANQNFGSRRLHSCREGRPARGARFKVYRSVREPERQLALSNWRFYSSRDLRITRESAASAPRRENHLEILDSARFGKLR